MKVVKACCLYHPEYYDSGMAYDLKEVEARLSSHGTDLRTFGVKRLLLFGSGVRSQATPTSDLDFLVDLEPKTFRNYMGLKFFLEDLFECPVDLVIAKSLKPALQEQVLSEAKRVA